MAIADLLKAALHKPYECGGCNGAGQYWDRADQNMVLCDWCDGDGRVDVPTGSRYVRRRRYSGALPFFGFGRSSGDDRFLTGD